jgi:hypothetical protein
MIMVIDKLSGRKNFSLRTYRTWPTRWPGKANTLKEVEEKHGLAELHVELEYGGIGEWCRSVLPDYCTCEQLEQHRRKKGLGYL